MSQSNRLGLLGRKVGMMLLFKNCKAMSLQIRRAYRRAGSLGAPLALLSF